MTSTIGLNFINVNPGYRALISYAVEKMEKVLLDPKFLEFLLLEINRSNDLEGELSKWKNATPLQIYMRLFPIDLHLTTYYTLRNVIAYGLANDPVIHLNTKYLDRYDVFNEEHLMLIGSNLLHEDGHDKGFSHDFFDTKRRKNSINYILNRVYERTYRYVYNIPEKVIPVRIPWYRRLFR